MLKAILQATGLHKEFDSTKILKGVDLTIHEGEFVAVMGQSGSGKSTLLYNISGMDKLTEGSIIFDGKDRSTLNDDEISDIRLKQMGFIFQQSHLLKTLSIRDNIVLPGFKAKVTDRQALIAYADSLMKQTGIDHIADHDIKKVSGGQLQRGAICRALINRPKILFADEPTGALNSSTTKEIMDIITHINAQGTAIMLVTHDAQVASRADRVIFLSDGKVTDEVILSKFDQKTADERVYTMTQWLNKQGF